MYGYELNLILRSSSRVQGSPHPATAHSFRDALRAVAATLRLGPRKSVWEGISDVSGYQIVAPNLKP